MLETDFLYPNDMIAQCEAARKLLAKENEDIEVLERSILEFVNDEELISHKISVAKAHFYDYYLLLEELKRANDGDIVAFNTLQSEIENNVNEDLCGDIIIPEQIRAHNNFLSDQAKADQYLNWANNNILFITNMNLCLLFTSLSNHYRQRAKQWFDLSIEYKQKMLLYDTIEYKTAGLFPGNREDIYARIRAGLEEIGVAYQNENVQRVWKSTELELVEIERTIDKDCDDSEKYKVAEDILRRYLTKQGIDPAGQNIVVQVVKESNPNMLSNLYTVSIYSSVDVDTVVEEIKDYYDSSQNCKMFSLDRIEQLKTLELAQYHLRTFDEDLNQYVGVGEYDNQGDLIGIYPYYVLKESNSGTYIDDGGITIGFGHHINVDEWEDENNADHILLSQYVSEDVRITGIIVEQNDLLDCHTVIVENSSYITIDEANQILADDIIKHSTVIANYLEEKDIVITQEQFDALVIYRFNKGSLSEIAKTYLLNENMDKDDWREVWTGGEIREEACQNIFFGMED